MNTNVHKALNDLSEGKIVIVTDHHNRENEGDFILAAEFANASNINFMTIAGRGLICAPMTKSKAKVLNLPLMVKENECTYKTAFTVSIDAKHNISSGISAFDRAYTLKLLSMDECVSTDFTRPGHIFPLIACDGGIEERPGHTEATVDLLKLAELTPVGVICEIMNDHGEMARGSELDKISEKFQITMISIQEILDYKEMLRTVPPIIENNVIDLQRH